MKTRIRRSLLSLALLSAAISPVASADENRHLSVTITNITAGQSFTPILVASHRGKLNFFETGEPASEALIAAAESGNTAPLSSILSSNPKVSDIQNSTGLLGPGESVTLELDAGEQRGRISLVSMMLPSNDSFIALDSVRLPRHGNSHTYFTPGYDAGSETNDESCINIPGPYCGGTGLSPADPGEGYVHISRGISGKADLAASDFDWRNDVAKVTVRYLSE